MIDKKENTRTFIRNGLKCECRVIRTGGKDFDMSLVDTPAGETWVSEDEFTEETI